MTKNRREGGLRRLLRDQDQDGQDEQRSGSRMAGVSPLVLRVPALFGIRRHMIKTTDRDPSRFRLSANDDTRYRVEYCGHRM